VVLVRSSSICPTSSTASSCLPTVLETLGQRKVGSCTIVLDPDGTHRVVEAFVQGRPWHHDPPAGMAHTTLEERKRLQRTTVHPIQSGDRPVAKHQSKL
jgi:hypothetical protein